MVHFLLHLCGMVDVVCSIAHASQDSGCGPQVVVLVVGDVLISVGGLAVH